MALIYKGRFTAKTDESFVVFLIGMRINKWWRFDKWLPVAGAMLPMLNTLFTHPEKGFLHAEFYWNLSGPVTIQYWRSFEDLEKFARAPSDLHLPVPSPGLSAMTAVASSRRSRTRPWCSDISIQIFS